MIGSIMDTTLPEQEGMYEKWPGLKRIIKMELKCTGNGVRSRETIYYLSRMEKDEVSYYANCIRAHWGIENKLHWHLDVTFREDMCRVRAQKVPSISPPCASMHWKLGHQSGSETRSF